MERPSGHAAHDPPGGGTGSLLGAAPALDAGLRRLLDAAAAADAVEGRRQEAGLRQLLEEETTLLAVLVGAAEAGANVVVATSASTHACTVAAVGRDVVVLASGRRRVVVPVRAVRWVRVLGRVPRDEPRRPPLDLTAAEVLAELAAERAEVTVWAEGSGPVSGAVEAVGTDVVRLRPGDGTAVVVPLGAVNEVRLG